MEVQSSHLMPLCVSRDALLKAMVPGGPGHTQVQSAYSGLFDRWRTLCDQLPSLRGDVSSVLIGWKGYDGVKGGLTGFVDGMLKVLGSDLTSSTPEEVDLSQLAEYKVCEP